MSSITDAYYAKPVAADTAKHGFRASDLLPAIGGTLGGLGGAALGSFVPVAGTTAGGIAGGAAGAAAGEKLRQYLTGEHNNNEILKQAAFGAGGEVAGGIIGLGAKALGRGAEVVGEGLANRAVTTSPTALRNFKALTGVNPGLYAAKEGLLGADAARVGEKVAEGSDAYAGALRDSGLNVSKSDIGGAFRKKITDLASSTDPAQQAQAEKLQQLYKNIIAKTGTDPVKLNAEKSLYDSAVKEGERLGGDASHITNQKAVADTIRGVLNEASDKVGGNLSAIGKRQQALYQLEKIAAQRDAQSALNNPASLSKLVGVVGGGATGASQGNTVGERVKNGLIGAAGGYAGSAVLNSRLGQSAIAGALEKTAASQVPSVASNIATRVAGQGSSRGIGAVLSPQGNPAQESNAQVAPGQLLGATAGTGQNAASPDAEQSDKRQQVLQQLILRDFQQTGGKNLGQLTALGKALGISSGTAKAPTASQAQAAGFADRVTQAEGVINQNTPEISGSGYLKGSIEKALPNAFKNDTFQSQDQAEQNFINAVLRRESGASISPSEYANARSQYLPQPRDSERTLKQKATNRQIILNSLKREASAQSYDPTDITSFLAQAAGQ